MFTARELQTSVEDPVLREDFAAVRAALLHQRLGAAERLDPTREQRLARFVDAVLASAPGWRPGAAIDILDQAAQAAEVLATGGSDTNEARIRLRAALLYELAAMPMMAAAMLSEADGPHFLVDFFKRRHAFGALGADVVLNGDAREPHLQSLLRLAACEDALALLDFEQEETPALQLQMDSMRDAARHLELDLSLTDVNAFYEVVRRRAQRSTRLLTPSRLLDSLRTIGFPPEMWESQAQALSGGLLDRQHDAWGLAAPTGTGKTFLARLLVLDALAGTPGSKVLYLVPTKALVFQVAQDLRKALSTAGIAVNAVRPQITALDGDEADEIAEASVLVLTPEKADLLLRIGAEFLEDISLVVVDEAHHIEEGTRGVLLELYLARLRATLSADARYVLLSAVAPNIGEMTTWMGKRPGFKLVEQRSTRMKVGVYQIRKEGRYNRGIIKYTDGTCLRLFERGVDRRITQGIVKLTERLGDGGPVLVVAHGKRQTERIARTLRHRLVEAGRTGLSAEQLASPVMARLDSRLEREMYAGVELRELVRFGIGYHHAGLPPRVREALETAITENLITFVIATTTLADGVNFPFSTVIVQALATQDPSFETGKPMSWRVFTPRKFWNIAGRAGRPGSDHEGQVILYEESLKLEHVGPIEPYLRPGIRDIPPVASALATGLREMREQVASKEFSLEDLDDPHLSATLPRRARGVVNLLRIGLAHARATGIQDDEGAYFDTTFAAQTMADEDRAFARSLVTQQETVVDDFLTTPDAPSVEIVAELGLSIDTLSSLQRYVKDLEDWRLRGMANVLYGGRINFRNLRYIISAVLKHMAELEGRSLSGWYSAVVEDWCRGKPFTQINGTDRESRLEDLIGLMYSEIQYILPWGLYATDRFVRAETALRGFPYDGEIHQLAYLVDAGVPNWPALRLTSIGFERTDASRLSQAYLESPQARETAEIAGWVVEQRKDRLAQIIRGDDRRRLDFDFDRLIRELGGEHPPPTTGSG